MSGDSPLYPPSRRLRWDGRCRTALLPSHSEPVRLNLRLAGNTAPVPFDHLHQLTGALHKWLGDDNPQHDRLSLYSFGWLDGAQPRDRSLAFPRGAE